VAASNSKRRDVDIRERLIFSEASATSGELPACLHLLTSIKIEGSSQMASALKIPKIIHQTYATLGLPDELRRNVDAIKRMNPDWEHRLYDDRLIEQFIEREYGKDMLQMYCRIDPRYGAARADLFRYLVIYKQGGVYLDIKSGTKLPLSDVIRPEDQIILTKWRNLPGEEHEGAGMAGPMRHIQGGEFQQWNLIAAPAHPFFKAVIDAVISNIKHYQFWRHGTGRRAVIRLTGPIAYTMAIEAIKNKHSYREVRGADSLGLIYSVLDNEKAHHTIFSNHYSKNTAPLVRQTGLSKVVGDVFGAGKRMATPVLQPLEAAIKFAILKVRNRRSN
jgi:hypothetical protein